MPAEIKITLIHDEKETGPTGELIHFEHKGKDCTARYKGECLPSSKDGTFYFGEVQNADTGEPIEITSGVKQAIARALRDSMRTITEAPGVEKL